MLKVLPFSLELKMIFMLVYSWTKIPLNLLTCTKSLLEVGQIPNLSLEKENKEPIKLLLPPQVSVTMIPIKNIMSLMSLELSLSIMSKMVLLTTSCPGLTPIH